MNIEIYTDGACKGNPGPGGYGTILSTTLSNGKLYEVRHSKGYRLTTNNRMELLAVIDGLSSLNGRYNVKVTSDSKYVCDAFNKGWIYDWHKRGWRKKTGGLPNRDMWVMLWDLVSKQEKVEFIWVKGHNNHKYNEECDKLAVNASNDSENWLIDMEYEKSTGK